MSPRTRLRWFFYPIFILGAASISLGILYYNQYWELKTVETAYASASAIFDYQVNELQQKLASEQQLNADMQTILQAREADNAAYSAQVQQLNSTVSQLDKLSKTDRELLEKYSSVYFLNENYVPSSLINMDTAYLFIKTKPQQIHSQVLPRLGALMEAARKEGIDISVLSAYRSFGTQEQLKSTYRVTYGSGTANSFSADQGYSEHQLGSAVDFTTQKTGSALTGFDKQPAFAWLQLHAHEYGFTLSYPKGNAHFVFEPWHWRFVGVELATRLHNEHKTLYDLDQRDINTYLIKIFD